MYAYASDTSRNKETFSRLMDRYFDPHLCESLPVSHTSIKMEWREVAEKHVNVDGHLCSEQKTDSRVKARKNLMFLKNDPAMASSHIKMALMEGKLVGERHKGFLVVLREYISKVDVALGPALSSQVHVPQIKKFFVVKEVFVLFLKP